MIYIPPSSLCKKRSKDEKRPVVASRKHKDKKQRIEPIRNEGPRVPRNALCPCGSGHKFKRCCGKPVRPESRTNPYKTMASQYTDEQKAAEQDFLRQWGFNPNPAQLMAFMEGDPDLASDIVAALKRIGAAEKHVAAAERLQRLVTPKNRKMLTKEEIAEWDAVMKEYQEGEDASNEHSCDGS